MKLISIPQYTEEQREARERLIELIEYETQAFLSRVKPYQDQLIALDSCVPTKHIMVPDV